MRKNELMKMLVNDGSVKALNLLVILASSIMSGFFSFAFFLGTEDDHYRHIQQLPWSFISRFAFFSIFGAIIIGLLVIINFIIKKVFLGADSEINLKNLFIVGLFSVVLLSFVGTVFFFI